MIRKISDENAIVVTDIHKSFHLPHERHSGIKQFIIGLFKHNRKKGYETQRVLKGISFEIKKGEFFGIVGRNGSGKSTMLKVLADIYTADSGKIDVNGSLIPFIELGVGFNPELTGRENVFLNGALLGFSREEMDAMYDDIVEFAELERFMDQKLKNYSSGMQVRLAFSVAIRADGDILLLDEVLAVGDEAFQRKCYSYFAELKRNKKTVVLVTHSMDSVQQFCDRAILIDKGHKTEIGSPLEIAQMYRELNDRDNVTVNINKDKNQKPETRYVDARVVCKKTQGKIALSVNLAPKAIVDDPIVAIGVYRDSGEQVYRWASDEKLPFQLDLASHKQINIELDDVFPVGQFTVNLYIKKRDRTINYAVFNDVARFRVKNRTSYEYATFWKIPEKTFVNNKEVDRVHR